MCSDLPGVEAGVYHFYPSKSALEGLRERDYRRALVDATGNEPAVANAPVMLAYADAFWRHAVKYQAREYRHAFWDSGTVISNTLAIAAAGSVPAKLATGFADESVNRLLDLDAQREVALAMVPVGYVPDAATGPSPEISLLELKTVPVSDHETDFPGLTRDARSFFADEWRRGGGMDSPFLTIKKWAGTMVEGVFRHPARR